MGWLPVSVPRVPHLPGTGGLVRSCSFPDEIQKRHPKHVRPSKPGLDLALSYSHPHFISCSRSHLLLFSHSIMSDSLQPHGLQHARPPCPSPNSRSPPKLISILSVMPSNRLILCRPFLLPLSIFPSIRVFSNESAVPIRWPEY